MVAVPKTGKPTEAQDATPVTAHVPADMIQALDAWIADQPDPKPTRPDAICVGLSEWLMFYRLSKNRPSERPRRAGRPKKAPLSALAPMRHSTIKLR